MKRLVLRFTALLLFVVVGCASEKNNRSAEQAMGDSAASPSSVNAQRVTLGDSLTGGVWTVTRSPEIAIGQIYEFRPDNTLIITTPGSSPATGSWRMTEGKLTITEESITYPVDILYLKNDSLSVRVLNPGPSTLIELRRLHR